MTIDFDNDDEDKKTDSDNDLPFDEETQPKKSLFGGNRNFVIAVSVLGGIFLVTVIALIVFASLILPRKNAERQAQIDQANLQNTTVAQSATAAEVANIIASSATVQATPEPSTTPTLEATAALESSPTSEEVASDTPEGGAAETSEPGTTEETATQVIAPTEDKSSSPNETEAVVKTLNQTERAATLNALYTQMASKGTYTPTATTQGGTPQPGTTVTATGLAGTIITNPDAMTATAQAGTGSGSTTASPTATQSGLPQTGFAEDYGIPMLIGGAFLLLVVIFMVRRMRSAQG